MVRNVVAGMQEDLQQENFPTDNLTTMSEPIDNVANAVQSIQKQLAIQLQQMMATLQNMQMQYAAAPQHTHQDYENHGYHHGHNHFCGQGGRGAQRQGNWIGGCGGRGSSDLTSYCWTRTMCVHPGTNCRTPTEGYKYNAVWYYTMPVSE